MPGTGYPGWDPRGRWAVDWYLSGSNGASATALRHQVREYLTRHSEPDSDVGDAELVVQELVANALEHATGPVWVHLSWLADQPELVVRDLGPGFALTDEPAPPHIPVQGAVPEAGNDDSATGQQLPDVLAEGGRGLFLATKLAPQLEVAARRGGGSAVTARLPVVRAPSRSIDPIAGVTEALPSLEEASAAGGFGREAFLRALVVQLAQAVEHAAGPDVAEDAVARVGAAVGGQMEAEYRAAKRISDRLTRDQIVECLVRLKQAISGGFYPLEVTNDRIVLGNDRCPFGSAVRKSPALCRMTSSVFGGIAARNGDEVSVVLEERIAVGDPGCRVVIYFGDPPESTQRFAHRYRGHALQELPGATSP